MQEGGDVVAYGKIAGSQPGSLGAIRVKTPHRNRLVLDIDEVLNPAAATILHLSPKPTADKPPTGKTKSGALTLGELQKGSPTLPFQMVSPVSLLDYDNRKVCVLILIFLPCHFLNKFQVLSDMEPESQNQLPSANPAILQVPYDTTHVRDQADDDDLLENNTSDSNVPASDNFDEENVDSEPVNLDMLEAHSAVTEKQQGLKFIPESFLSYSQYHIIGKQPEGPELNSDVQDFIKKLQTLVNSPPDEANIYTFIKKDIFHAFNMIPTSLSHGARPGFLRALRDHIMRWDPDCRAVVDQTCRTVFNLTFDQMLARNPRFIAERTPRYIPPPSVLVPAISHVFTIFGNALDAKTNAPLFTKQAWEKAKAVLELARQGYLSDNPGIVLYEKAGLDKYGLQKQKCLRGTNNVEGGPHGDIYRKFGALNGMLFYSF